jgi:hypothetical protein
MLGFGKRVSYAFRCFFSVLSNGEVPADIAPELVQNLAPPAPLRQRRPPRHNPPPPSPNRLTAPCRCSRSCSATGG